MTQTLERLRRWSCRIARNCHFSGHLRRSDRCPTCADTWSNHRDTSVEIAPIVGPPAGLLV